jgi:predicted negative regulator of RcsB-dependent stress response
MKIYSRNQAGVAHLAGLMVLVFVAIVGFAAYRVWQNQKDTPQDAVTSTAVSQAKSIPITTTSDLDQATAAANNLQVDSDLDPTQLDSDINQLQ